MSLIDEKGRVGRGEASPLPGFSPDSLANAEEALKSLDREQLPRPGDKVLPALEQAGQLIDAGCPSARFALETALLDLFSQALNRPAWDVLASALARGKTVIELPLAAWIDGASEVELVSAARTALDRGARAIKLKLGPVEYAQRDYARIRALRSAFGSELILRLDANGTRTAAQATDMLGALARYAPEFVEEPVCERDVFMLDVSPLPIALDETLRRLGSPEDLATVLANANADVIVLKPTLLGGLLRCAAFAAEARRLEADVIVSHTLEGPVALSACAALAIAIGTPRRAQGLWPHRALSAFSELALESTAIVDGRLIAPTTPGLALVATS